MKKVILLMLVTLVTMFTSYAQWGDMGMGSKIVLKSGGDLNKIKTEKTFKVEYDYSKMKVGEYNTEAEYVDKKVKEYEKKEKGKGDKWKEGWVGSRKDRYEPKFEELFNKASDGMTVAQNPPKSKYTLIVKTVFLEPGYNIGISKKPAFVNFEFTFVETENPATIVAELYANNVIGSQSMGFDFDSGSRIAESYAKAGKMLGKFLAK